MNSKTFRTIIQTIIALIVFTSAAILPSSGVQADGPKIELQPIGRFTTGVFDDAAAEIVAYDPATQRLFIVNANAATIDVLDINDPTNPTPLPSIDVTPYGAEANSVDVHEGVIAVAVENAVKTNPGSVMFFNVDGQFLSSVQVGALLDMLTFTPNGRFVLVANEGEPNDDYTIDPEGSISIIRIGRGVDDLTQDTDC